MIFAIKATKVMEAVEMESLVSTPMPSFLETPSRIQSADQNAYEMINVTEHFATDFKNLKPLLQKGLTK